MCIRVTELLPYLRWLYVLAVVDRLHALQFGCGTKDGRLLLILQWPGQRKQACKECDAALLCKDTPDTFIVFGDIVVIGYHILWQAVLCGNTRRFWFDDESSGTHMPYLL